MGYIDLFSSHRQKSQGIHHPLLIWSQLMVNPEGVVSFFLSSLGE